MPSAPHLGMGPRSTSSPTLSTAANSTSASTAPALAASSTSPVASEDPSPAPSPLPSTSSRPGFLSRLLPLRGRNRNVADFHIRPDEPYKKYSAGEHVGGAVVLVVVKPVRITHLVVSLHGYVRVRKDPSTAAKAQSTSTLPQGGGSTRPRYHGNGFVSLFQDEQVLSGEGRLEPGKYEFGFDLVFPEKGLPSSIDFERGTISYMITATLTRPTSIAATSSCDRKVMLVDKVDIGLLPPPRPRTIFLEPISKRTRRKKSMGLEKVSVAAVEVHDPPSSEADSAEPPNGTDDRDHANANDARSPIQSDMRSEVSGESGLSASTGVSRTELALSQVGTLSQSAKQQAVDDKTITATIELLRGGCLPGDAVSIRVTVQHVKRVKSMTGVIVTLYRQGKVDVAPPPSMFTDAPTDNEARWVDKEEVYPRSRTGLGGLSLSSSGSTSVFRKDLDQNMAPLIIDPATMQTSVTVPVKMPDDSFPTIKGVPGEMISFKYLVEVVVDLGGRLSNQFQGVQTSRFGSFGHGTWDASSNTYGPRRGANMADTTQLRREKGVISVSMETVVGTVDSSRGRKRSKASPSSPRYRMTESDDEEVIRPDLGYAEEVPYDPYVTMNGHISANGYFSPQSNGGRYLPSAPIPQPYPPPPLPSHPSHTLQLSQPSQPAQAPDPFPRPDYSEVNGHTREAAPIYIPPPEVADQAQLSEKERVRQAETRLLPSQPPAGPSSSRNDDDNIYDAEDTPRPVYVQASPSDDNAGEGPSAPTHDDLSVATATPGDLEEDKLEVERRRLMNEASSPPEFPEDAEQRNGGPSTRETAPDAEPSAPMLDDADDFPGYGSGTGSRPSGHPNHGDGEQLPAYQR